MPFLARRDLSTGRWAHDAAMTHATHARFGLLTAVWSTLLLLAIWQLVAGDRAPLLSALMVATGALGVLLSALRWRKLARAHVTDGEHQRG